MCSSGSTRALLMGMRKREKNAPPQMAAVSTAPDNCCYPRTSDQLTDTTKMENRTKLQAVRRELGYPAATVLRLLAERARAHNVTIMTPASLKTKLSRWENGHEAVGLPEYRRLFREIYGRTDAELGFPDDDSASNAAE